MNTFDKAAAEVAKIPVGLSPDGDMAHMGQFVSQEVVAAVLSAVAEDMDDSVDGKIVRAHLKSVLNGCH